MSLCYECREWLRGKYGSNYYVAPYQHCHHDQLEQKPLVKCKWCKDFKEFMSYGFKNDDLWLLGHYLITGGKKIEKCPMCGAEVKEKK
jgi:rubrerythrin